MPMRLSSLLLFVMLLLTSGCSFLPEQIDETSEWSANQLYNEAKQELASKNYEKAIDYFERLEARFPFGQYAQQAQLEIAYAYYKFEEPELAIAAADRFIKIYPRHPNVDYAWYIKGLTNYNRGKAFIERYLPQEPAERDTRSMRQSHDDFAQLVQRYPNSTYAKDAAQRMIHLRNNMAEYEIHVAEYYIRRTAYVAAANRGKYVIENFQRTPSVEGALVVMVRAYRSLGVNDLANSAMRVLQINYPDSPDIVWLNDPRGYEVAREGSGFWGGLKFWKSEDDSSTTTAAHKENPSYWSSWKPWKSEAEAGEPEKQESDQWEGYQYRKPATEKPVQSPARETGTEAGHWGGWEPWKPDTTTDADTKAADGKPGLLENLKFWERKTDTSKDAPATDAETQEPSLWEDWQGTGATEAGDEEQTPPFWNDWNFWKQDSETPQPETGEQDPSVWENWKFWEQETGASEAEDGEPEPGLWERFIGTPDDSENSNESQEPSLWEGWQRPVENTKETTSEDSPAATSGDESGSIGGFKYTPWKPWKPDTKDAETDAPVTEDSNTDPAFWEDLKFWEKDQQEADTPENTDTGEEPAFWEGWKFWETPPEETTPEQ